jgi:hypothetical protein
MMVKVLATEMEGSSVQSYLPITALCGFEMTNAVDKTQGFQTFRMDTTNVHHLPHGELSAVVFLIIAPILTAGSCESTSFHFSRSNTFGGYSPSASTP